MTLNRGACADAAKTTSLNVQIISWSSAGLWLVSQPLVSTVGSSSGVVATACAFCAPLATAVEPVAIFTIRRVTISPLPPSFT